MSSVYEQNKEKLLSLGFAFQGKVPSRAADPEKTIVDLLPSFYVDRKLFRLLLTWLHKTSDVIHVERLKALSKDLAPGHKVVLGILARKLSQKDRRWNLLCTALKASLKQTPPSLQLPRELSDPYLVAKNGRDKEMAEFGIEAAQINPEDGKKVLSWRGILRTNGWLHLRALMGPNFRADVAYLYLSGAAVGPAGAARLLACSRETAYRNWRALDDADARRVLKLVRM